MGWDVYPNGTYLKTRKFDDPLQGACDSCICLASLASMAWTGSTFYDNSRTVWTDGNGYNYYEFKFYPNNVEKRVRVSERLCLDGAKKQVFASSKEADELWPSLYEKAYAAFIKNNRNSVLPGIDTLVMGNMIFVRNGKVTLSDLSRKATEDKDISTLADGTAVYNHINQKSPTTKPMIAWSPPGNGVVDGITLNHTYSVLGVYNSTHIILRDPKRGAVEPSDSNYVLRNGLIQVGNVNIDLSDYTDGIFAYHKDKFKNRFYKLAYATV